VSEATLPKRRLERSGVEVTEIGYGSAPIGGSRYPVSEHDADSAMEAAWAAGMRYYDTSPFYGYGRGEMRIGRFLRSVDREQAILSTKVGRYMRPVRGGDNTSNLRPFGLKFMPVFDYTYDGTMRSLEQSWVRLGLPRIDIAFIHDIDVWTHGDEEVTKRLFDIAMNGAYRALDELRKSGEIKAIGAGVNQQEWSRRFVEAGEFDCMMLAGRYTLIDHEPEVLDYFEVCKKKGVGILLAGVFNSGILATGSIPTATFDYVPAEEKIHAKVRKIEAVCRKHNVPLAGAAVKFALAQPVIKSTVLGAIKGSEVASNMAALRHPIPAAFWSDLKSEGLLSAAVPVPS
jgi:D-threo-aldose 1-dehydrogenase